MERGEQEPGGVDQLPDDPLRNIDWDADEIPSNCPTCRDAARQFDEQTSSSASNSTLDPCVRVSIDLGPALNFEDCTACATCRTIWNLVLERELAGCPCGKSQHSFCPKCGIWLAYTAEFHSDCSMSHEYAPSFLRCTKESLEDDRYGYYLLIKLIALCLIHCRLCSSQLITCSADMPIPGENS